MAQSKPIEKFRAGSVSCALWENDISVNGRKATVLKATVERRYKDGDSWKSSNSFSRNEIPLAIYCLQKAFDAIIASQQSANDQPTEEEVEQA